MINHSKHLFIVILLLTITSLSAQKIVKNEVDEFEGVRIVETSWEWIKKNGLSKNGQSFFRLRMIGDELYFDYKKALTPITSVESGEIYKIIDDDGKVHALHNTSPQVATSDQARKGAYNIDKVGYNLSMVIPDEMIAALKSGVVLQKARLITSDGNAEEKWGKKTTKKLYKCLQLMGKLK